MPSDDMSDRNPDLESPFNKLPVVVVVLFLIMAGVEAVLALGEAGLVGGPSAIGWRLGLVRDWGFSGDLFDAMWADGYFPLEHMARFLTYPFIHLSFTHALLAIVLMLAAGIVIEFLLVVYMGRGIMDQTQRFIDLDRCLYFAERLSTQRSIQIEGRSVKITALCKPVPK